MHETDALLVAGEVAAAAGIDKKTGVERLSPAGIVARLDGDEVRAGVIESGDGKTFAHFRAGLLGVSEQQIIEPGAFDLECGGLPSIVPVAKDQLQALRAVAGMELRAGFEGETFLVQRFQHAHFRKEPAVVGKERFANVKARETLFFQDKNMFAGTGEKGGRAAAARTTAD